MPHADYYKSGDYNAVCSMCGGKFKAGELRKHWQGMYRCAECWEPRQPQDFVKAPPPETPPPWIQPPNDVFAPSCSAQTRSAVPGSAGPGCAIPSYVFFGAQPVDLAEGTASVWWGNGPAPVPTNTSWPPPPTPPVLIPFAYIATVDSTTMGMGVVAGYKCFDGVTWLPATSPCEIVRGIAGSYARQRLVMIGFEVDGDPAQKCFYSDDFGDTWTEGTLPANVAVGSASVCYAILWSPTYNKFFAAGENTLSNTATVLESSDGITWTSAVVGTFSSQVTIYEGNGRVIAPISSNRYLVSTNGTSWSEPTGSGFNVDTAIWADDLSLFIKAGTAIQSSSAGVNWSSVQALSPQAHTVAQDPLTGRFSCGLTNAWMSADGTTWTQGNNPAPSLQRNRKVLWSRTWGKFLSMNRLTGVTPTTYLYASVDGEDWAIEFFAEWISGDGNFVIVE